MRGLGILSLVLICQLGIAQAQTPSAALAPTAPTPTVADGSERFPKVFVLIDKSITTARPYQSIQIQVVNQNGSLVPIGSYVDKVSTGGGFKNPTGIANKAPYCASTPVFPKSNVVDKKAGVYLAAHDPGFQFQYIPALLKGPRITMEKVHYSRTFEDDYGDQIPMPWAIHVTGGIYLHEVPPAYVDLLGYAVSGGCVRLHPTTAKLLWDLMLHYGGIHLAITGQNPAPLKLKRKNKKWIDTTCTKEMIEEAKWQRDIKEELPWLTKDKSSPRPSQPAFRLPWSSGGGLFN